MTLKEYKKKLIQTTDLIHVSNQVLIYLKLSNADQGLIN